ncbi:hypothetical protein Hanom_Chr14g01255241 [Helianthus anomalus]
MLVDAYELQPEQSYPFEKKSDEEVEAKEVKSNKKYVTKTVTHISKCDPEKREKFVVKPTVKRMERAKTDEVGKKKTDVEGGPETAPVVEEIPVNAGFHAEFEECMNVDVGPKTVPFVDTSDIEKYYRETCEWGQTQQS